MRLGIRAKLVGTLLLAGILPLALALGIILVSVVELRVQSKGRMYRALAEQQAAHLSLVLAAQIELADAVNAIPGTIDVLEKANTVPPLSQEQIDKIEAAWPSYTPDKGLLQTILNNRLSQRWKAVHDQQSRFSEVIVTDITGRLIAATDKTSDYFQADEDWWKICYDNGKGKPVMSSIIFDESAISPEGKRGTMVTDLCMPIYSSPDPRTRKLIGICKMSIDATWIVRQLDMHASADELPRATWLVNERGEALLGDKSSAPTQKLPPKAAQRLKSDGEAWLIDDELEGYEVMAFAPVERSRLVMDPGQHWSIVVATSKSLVLGQVYRMAWRILGLGALLIAACFLGGMRIIRRGIIKPLTTLRDGVDQLKAGNRSFRLPESRTPDAIFGEDEIGRLARDFNLMAQQLETNLERIEVSDAMKRQFIDLASHELRTPVTYILGATQLAQRMNGHSDPALLTRISSKAQRLNKIVENMFKLLAADHFERSPRIVQLDLIAIVQGVCQEHEPFLHERHQTWDIHVATDLPPVWADPEKIRDIISNLISNAIRFSPDGGIVAVRVSKVDAIRGPAVEIAVSDTGPGIPAADLPNLFQPFFTGADVARHSSGDYQYMSRGMGLGLSVVKRFVELLGGGVAVETSSKGTAIRVRLPSGPRPENASGAGGSPAAESESAKPPGM